MKSPKDHASKGKRVGAIVQAVRLLKAVRASDRPLGTSALAREAKVNPSTAFNILRTLDADNILKFDEVSKTYSLGEGLLHLASGLFEQSMVKAIRPEINRLATETGCLIGLWQVTQTKMILVERAVSDRPVRLDTADRQQLPLMVGAVGRALAASEGLPDDALKEHFKHLRWATPITARQYIQDVRKAERDGYAIDREILYKGIISIGSIVKDRDGRALYGLIASDLANNVNEAQAAVIGERLAGIANRFSTHV